MEFQSVRLAALLRDMALRASSLHENMIVELDIRDNEIEVQADPTRLAQVFDNLFSNAAKYAPGSKTLLSLTAEDHEAHIIIRDYGEGIPPEHLNKLFTRFYRVPDQPAAVRGSGLGLFICRWIIRAHGGEIVAESTPGHGAVFHIYLPCIQLSGG
jgi:signal transduction histidine kinase